MKRSPLLVAALVASAFLFHSVQPLARPDDALDDAPPAVRDAILDADYATAEALLSTLLKEQPQRGDLWLLLSARVSVERGSLADAEAALARVERDFPSSGWRPKARLERASLLHQLRRDPEAEAIVAADAAALLADGRRTELVRLVVDLGDARARPPADPGGAKPDYVRAVALYQAALDLDPPKALGNEIRLKLGLTAQKAGNADLAIAALTRFLAEGGAAAATPDGASARLALGRAKRAANDPVGARRALEDLVDELARTPDLSAELAKSKADALLAIADTWSVQGRENVPLRIAALRRFLDQHPRHAESWSAAFAVVDGWQTLGRTDDALAALDWILARPDGEFGAGSADEARRQKALASFRRGELLLLQEKAELAAAAFTDCVARDPSGPRWTEAQAHGIEAEYVLGEIAARHGDFAAARARHATFIAHHPLDLRVPAMKLAIGHWFEREATKRLEDAGERPAPEVVAAATALRREAVAFLKELARGLPGSDAASHALFSAAALLEEELGDVEAAVETYRLCNFGSRAGAAQLRLVEMTTPALSVATPRAFTTAEAPFLQLETRNVAEVSVALHHLDLEAYFRKYVGTAGVEQLDLDLIAPDRRLTAKVDGYARWKPLTQELALPLEGAGAWIAVVSAEGRRATTLVLRSDVDIVVKSSRHDVLVYAQDRRTQRPVADVSLLIDLLCNATGNGARVQIEGKTGADGIFHATSDELRAAPGIQVLARKDGSVACSGVSLSEVAAAPALTRRGVVITDRPAYRPGDVVQLRALVREPRDGRLEVPAAGDGKGAAWQLEVADPAGRTLHRSELPLSPFGSVHDAFALDALAATGTYTVRFATVAGEAPPVAGRFEVLDYRLDRVTLDLDLPRRVWYRGETIELTARALYHFGAPVADADLTVTLPDGQIVVLRTDAEGRATVRFDTREQPAEATLTFRVLLAAEAVQAAANAFVATREFDVAVALDRDVFLAGERFTVRVKTTARDGSPTGRAGRLVVARRDDRGAETKVDEQKLETGKDAAHPGAAELALALEKGGDYVVRFEAVDRFGNTVDGEADVAISDDHDRQRMRLLSDRTSLEVGEAAAVRLVQRAGAGVVLVTWENAFGIQWQLVETNDGTHPIEFVAADAQVPGFVLAAAAVRGTKLHTASAPFAVTRALKLSVTPRGAVARPGEETTLDVVATDPLGRPVAAEVSIGVVDEALLRIAGDGTPDLASVFALAAPLPYASEGGEGFPTRSSCTFRYDGVTNRIAATVLEEQERARAAEKWQQARHALAENLSQLGEQRADDARDVAELKDFDAAKADPDGAMGADGASAFASKRAGGGGRAMGGTAIGVGAGRRAAKTSHGDSADTAFFVADLVTGADGRASVTFRMPGQTSRFQITARGITQDTRAATTTATLESRAEFFAELRLPPLLVEGDAPRFLARVFHGPGLTGSADLELTVRDGERVHVLTGRVQLSGAALIDHLFDALPPVALCDAAHLTLKATAHFDGRDVADSFEADVPVRPWGIERVDAQGGELTTSATFFLELPKDLAWRSRRLDLLLGPAAHRFLIDDALRRSPFRACDFDDLRPPTQADAAAELFGLAAVVDMVRGRNDAADAGDLLALRRRGEGLLARLVATQQKDGGWPWAGAKDSDASTSALALAALGRAGASGFTVPPPVLDAGLRYGEKAFRDAPAQADELKALLQFGLAWHARADFGALNRLHRGRASLSTAALAYTGLALAQSGKLPMAAEVAALLEQRAAVETATPAGLAERCSWPTTANTAWNRSRTEMAALALLALEKASPRSTSIARGAQYLLAQRPWSPSRAAGFAWAALAGWFAEAAPASDEARVRVRVNDQEVATLRFSGRETGTRVPVKPELLGDPAAPNAKVKVELTLEGRGRPSFLAALRGFTAEVKRHDDAEMRVWRQAMLAPPPLLRGRPLPTGFSILTQTPPNAWENAVTQLPLGGRADCEVRVGRPGRARPAGDEPPPLVVEIPIPAGADVLEGSVSGDFRSFVERPGALVFEIAGGSGSSSLRWSLLGRTPGSYRVLPPVVRGAYDADLEAHGDARTFDVLPAGAASKDAYRATPDERLERGKRSFESGDRAGGAAELDALLTEFGDSLRDAPYREAARLLLLAALDGKDDARIVRSFETLKEKDPDFTLGFEPVLRVASAYRTMKEFERAYLLETALLDEAFGKDLKVAGLLADEGRLRRAFALREQLWLAYPASAVSLQAWLALSDEMLTLAPRAHEDARLKAEKLDRAELQRSGMRLLMRFLSLHPGDPLAPEAGLSLVSAWLSLEDYAQGSALAGRLAKRYAKPRFADSFLYSKAVAEWSLGHVDDAVQLLERIATVETVDESGRKAPSVNRALAWYILGQVHHARRDAAKAIDAYERVADQFADAREALQALRERQLVLPELSIARPGEPAQVTVSSRNLKSAELLVYPVDLLTLCLREKNLQHVAEVKLAGIAPVVRTQVELATKDPFVAVEQVVRLPLEKAGAYLVLCRAEERHASGLVLVTPLDLEVREDASGRVRTHVLRHADQAYVPGVDVRVVGSADAEFRAGKSDPRGLFIADGVHGTTTVIARLGGDQYAFFRGTTSLGLPPPGAPAEKAATGADPAQQKEEYGQQGDYFRNVFEMNKNLQQERQQNWKKEVEKSRKGVQINKSQ